MLKQTHFLALDEAKVGNAKKPLRPFCLESVLLQTVL